MLIARMNHTEWKKVSLFVGEELWLNLGDDDLRKAAYRGGWKPA
jgi:hypothetical protein